LPELGEVDTPLGTLKSTLRAARTVNSMGGFAEVFRKLAVFDFDAYVSVVAAGLGKKPSEVEDDVFKAGLPALVEPLSTYVEYLSNGGKPLKPAPEGAASGEK
jgi:hypothetical protein